MEHKIIRRIIRKRWNFLVFDDGISQFFCSRLLTPASFGYFWFSFPKNILNEITKKKPTNYRTIQTTRLISWYYTFSSSSTHSHHRNKQITLLLKKSNDSSSLRLILFKFLFPKGSLYLNLFATRVFKYQEDTENY